MFEFGIGGGTGLALVAIASFLILFVYDVAFEVWNGGRTPGKKVNGLRVVVADGRPVTFVRSAARNLLRIIDVYFFFVGAFFILFTKENQRLGDLVADTLVVRELAAPSAFTRIGPDPGAGPGGHACVGRLRGDRGRAGRGALVPDAPPGDHGRGARPDLGDARAEAPPEGRRHRDLRARGRGLPERARPREGRAAVRLPGGIVEVEDARDLRLAGGAMLGLGLLLPLLPGPDGVPCPCVGSPGCRVPSAG